MIKDELVKKVFTKLKKNDAIIIKLFGSYAGNDEKSMSDIDLIVQFDKRNTFSLKKISRELSEVYLKRTDTRFANGIIMVFFQIGRKKT